MHKYGRNHRIVLFKGAGNQRTEDQLGGCDGQDSADRNHPAGRSCDQSGNRHNDPQGGDQCSYGIGQIVDIGTGSKEGSHQGGRRKQSACRHHAYGRLFRRFPDDTKGLRRRTARRADSLHPRPQAIHSYISTVPTPSGAPLRNMIMWKG